MFEFKMNNHSWNIIELPLEQIKPLYEKYSGEETLYVYGLTKFDEQKIYINTELCFDIKRTTLMHELMHCYKQEYVSLELDNIDEETLCNLSANSHDIIHDIVERYFDTKPISNITIKSNLSGNEIVEYLKTKKEEENERVRCK
jgi:hypothetical protein